MKLLYARPYSLFWPYVYIPKAQLGTLSTLLSCFSPKKRQCRPPQPLADSFSNACIVRLRYHAAATYGEILSCSCTTVPWPREERLCCFPCMYTAWPPHARILQGRRAPGGASGQGIAPSTPRPTMIAGAKANVTKVGHATLKGVLLGPFCCRTHRDSFYTVEQPKILSVPRVFCSCGHCLRRARTVDLAETRLLGGVYC